MSERPPGWRAPLSRAAPFALIVAAVAIYDWHYHEFWRDEACAVLEATAVPWSGLLHAMRIEGIPPLYHVLLKLLALVLPNPAALVAAGAIGLSTLLLGTYRLVDSVAASKKTALALTLALSLTYTYAYELGAIIRQYSLGLGLALLSMAYFRAALPDLGRRKIRAGAAFAGLSALTSAHSACLAGAALLAFGLVCLTSREGRRACWPVVLTLPCFALVVHLALPFAGRTPEANRIALHQGGAASRIAVQLLVEGLVPRDWWRAESFLPSGLALPFAALQSLGFWGILAAIGLAARARADALRGKARALGFEVVAVTAGIAPLLFIMVYRYWGSYRHQLFLGTPAVVMAAAWMFDRAPASPPARLARRAAAVAMIPWFLLQVTMAVVDFAVDYRYPFSDTKHAAEALPPDSHVVGKDEWQSAAIIFWRPDVHYRSPAGKGRPYRYTSPDRDWHEGVPLPSLVEQECREAPGRVFFAGPLYSLGIHARCGTEVPFPAMPPGDHPYTWESFKLFRVDCACVAEKEAPYEDAPDEDP